MKILKAEKPRLLSQIEQIKADPYAKRMWDKGVPFPVLVYDVPAWMANIIKQEALAAGIDAAVAKGCINCTVDKTDVIILGSRRGVRILAERLDRQGVSLPFLAKELRDLLSKRPFQLRMRDRILPLEQAVIMGILNLTPDSFSDGGMYNSKENAEARIKQIFDEGARFIDIGAVSTRPGHTLPDIGEEIARLKGVVAQAAKIAARYDAFVSVDTFRAPAAKLALDEGADFINDQHALKEQEMQELCAKSGVGVCVMHSGGGPDLVNEIFKFYEKKTSELALAGIEADRTIYDPGFGFGKTAEENYNLLRYLQELCTDDYPQLVGMSRKSMIGAATGEDVANRDAGTVAADTVALMAGAKIIRTHNVRNAMAALNIYKHVCKESITA